MDAQQSSFWLLIFLALIAMILIFRKKKKAIDQNNIDAGKGTSGENLLNLNEKQSLKPKFKTIDYEDEDDKRYFDFVESKWREANVSLDGVTGQRYNRHNKLFYDVVFSSLVTNERRQAIYVNVIEDGVRKTFACDSRHKWARNGALFSHKAFQSIADGSSPVSALDHAVFPDFIDYPLPQRNTETGFLLQIEYINSSGDASSRIVRPVRIIENHLEYVQFEAFCYLRNELRNFRTDRIRSAKLFNEDVLIEDVRSFLKMIHEASELKGFQQLVLMILVWIFKADREIDKTERRFIIDMLFTLIKSNESSIQEKMISSAIDFKISSSQVTLAEIKSIASQKKYKNRIADIRDILDTIDLSPDFSQSKKRISQIRNLLSNE